MASYYHTFSKLNEGFRGGKKITNIISKIKRIEEQQHEYEIDSRSLLEWIAVKTDQMRKRSFANSLEGVQNDVRLFKVYMTREKPPKCQEKVNIEANFFEIEMKLKELRQNPFVPPEGQRLPDIDQVKIQLKYPPLSIFMGNNIFSTKFFKKSCDTIKETLTF